MPTFNLENNKRLRSYFSIALTYFLSRLWLMSELIHHKGKCSIQRCCFTLCGLHNDDKSQSSEKMVMEMGKPLKKLFYTWAIAPLFESLCECIIVLGQYHTINWYVPLSDASFLQKFEVSESFWYLAFLVFYTNVTLIHFDSKVLWLPRIGISLILEFVGSEADSIDDFETLWSSRYDREYAGFCLGAMISLFMTS